MRFSVRSHDDVCFFLRLFRVSNDADRRPQEEETQFKLQKRIGGILSACEYRHLQTSDRQAQHDTIISVVSSGPAKRRHHKDEE